MHPLAVDVLAQAIRVNDREIAAGTLAERYLRALHAAGYIVKHRTDTNPGSTDQHPILREAGESQ